MRHRALLSNHSHYLSEESPKGTEVEVEILVLKTELALQSLHLLGKLHEGGAESFDFSVGQRAGIDTPEGLAFQELANEFDEREDQFGQSVLRVVGPQGDPPGMGRSGRGHHGGKVAQ